MTITPFEFQQKDIDLFTWHGGTGASASDPGAGKTVSSLFTAKQLGAEVVLVTGPKSTKSSWEVDSAKILDLEFRPMDSSKNGKMNLLHLRNRVPGVYFAGIEWFRGLHWGHYKPDMHLADEIHKMSARGTVGQKALWTSAPDARMAISGTMVRNKIENMWSVLRWMYPDMEFWYPDEAYFIRHPEVNPNSMSAFSKGKRIRDLDPKHYWQWAELFLILKQGFFATEVVGERIPGEMVSLMPAYVRHLKRENCCEDHPEGFATWPEPVEKTITIAPTPTMKRIDKELDSQDLAWLGDNVMVTKMPLESRMRRMQVALAEPTLVEEDGKLKVTFAPDAKSPKLDWIETEANEGVLFGEQYVVMTHSKHWAKMAAARLGGFAWTGDETQENRDAAKAEFVKGNLRCVVAVISAFGTGTTDFQKAANNIVWASRGDDITDITQGSGRLDRIGQTKGVIEWTLLTERTLEAGVMSKQLEKRLVLNKSLAKA